MIFRVPVPPGRRPVRPHPHPAGRQRIVLAALLLEVNRQVSTDYLVDAIWERPPETAHPSRSASPASAASPPPAPPRNPHPNYLLRVNP